MRPSVHFKTYQKVISMFLVLCFFVIPFTTLTLPKKAEAVCVPIPAPPIPDPLSVPVHMSATSVTNIKDDAQKNMDWFKNCILDGMATLIAKTIIKALTKSIVTWINSGFKGNPSFVQNTGQFFGGIADKVAGNTIEQIAPFLCSPFKLNIQMALALSMTSGTQDEISCTLTDVENNFNNFVNGTGGSWDNWFQITQNPQNNPYGAMMIAQAQMSASIETAQGKYQQQLDWGKGFLSFEDCPASPFKGGISGAPGEVPNIPAGEGGTLNTGNTYSVGTPSKSPSIQGNSYNNSLASIGSLGLLDTVLGNSNSNALAATVVPGAYGPSDIRPITNNGAPTGQYLLPVNNVPGQTNGHYFTNSQDTGANKPVYTADNPNTPVHGVMAGNNGCLTKTPGAVVESQLENVLGSDLRGLEIAQSIDQIVEALVGQLITQAIGGLQGLTGAGNQSSSGGGSNFNYQNSINAGGAAGVAIPDLPIMGFCTPSPQTAQIGETVTWNAYIPDINGNVEYEWGDDENLLSSNSASATTSYATNGEKSAYVIITNTSNPQGVVIDCMQGVSIGNVSAIANMPTISCEASSNTASINTPVTWQAVTIGGVPPFVYSWQGSDGLANVGQSTIKSYATPGIKTATVNVTSADGYTYSRTCSNTVNVTP